MQACSATFTLLEAPITLAALAKHLATRQDFVLYPCQSSALNVLQLVAPPYGYEGYVASLDVSALTATQYGLIRSFLLRVMELTWPARSTLAANLGNQTAAQVRHTPPVGINPEVFLVCVASAYQRRHGGT